MATRKYLSSLQMGARVKFGSFHGAKLKWIIAEKNHYGYPDNSVTLLTEEQVATLAYDAAEPYAETSDMRWYGRGWYSYSNINQWLESAAAAAQWYSATHPTDHSPSRGYVDYDPYKDWPGFLNGFDPQEIAMLLPTTRDVRLSSNFGKGYTESVTSQMFLPTDAECGYANRTRGILEYYRSTSNRKSHLSKDAIEHAQTSSKRTLTEGADYPTMTASGYEDDREKVYRIGTNGLHETAYAYESAGIRPACNLSADTQITTEPDEDGYYVVVVNYPPTEPAPIRQEYADDTLEAGYIRSGRSIAISWGRATDPDGNFDHYELERRYGDGDFQQIYSGTDRTFTDTAKHGEASVTYRVRAVDYYDAASEWVTATTLNIWSNEPPVLTVDKTDLGTLQMTGPTVNYKYRDPDASNVTLTISLDGKQYRSLTLAATTEDKAGSFRFTDEEWLKVQNGSHVLRFVLTDTHQETSVKTVDFTKAVPKLQFSRMKPIEATEAPTELILRVNGDFPEDNITAEVCNNAFDDSPTWEDMTEAFLDEGIYTFTNTVKTAETFGVNFRITIERGDATGDIYVESVTCNFLAGESSTSARIGRGVSVNTVDNDAGGQTLVIGG